MSEVLFQVSPNKEAWSQAKKAAETESVIAPSQEKELLTLQQTQKDDAVQPATLSSKKESNFSETRRYKNPLLLIFAIMCVARVTLREGLKETKGHNRRLKNDWETISKKQSKNHGKAKTDNDKLGWCSGILFAASMGIKGLASTDKLGKKLTEYASWGADMAKSSGSQVIDQWGKSLQIDNQKTNVLLEQGSQASQADYQTRMQDESSEKGALDMLNRTSEELMRQESQLFMGSRGG